MAKMNQNSASPQTAEKQTNFRIPSIIFAAIFVLALFVPVKCITFDVTYSMYTSYSHMLVVVFLNLLGSRSTILGFLPSFGEGALGLGATLALYVCAIGVLVAIVLAVIAIFHKKGAACLLKTALFFFTWAIAIHTLAVTVISSYLLSMKATVDVMGVIFSLAGALCFLYILLKENKKSAWLIAGQFLLVLATAAFLFLALTLDGHLVSKMIASPRVKFLVKVASVAIFASLFLTTVLSLKHNKWTALLQLVNAIALLALSVCLLLVSYLTGAYIESYLMYTIFATITAFLAILLCIVNFAVIEKKAEAAAEDLYLNNYEVEEYVEVTAYDPAKAQYAEKVENSDAASAQPVAEEEEIADDPEKEALFEGKEDAFIATLTKAEKYEFADLYILKKKGNLGAIPTYEVGETNKAFFKKIFIYLSQYREKISSELLAKIYDYSEQE